MKHVPILFPLSLLIAGACAAPDERGPAAEAVAPARLDASPSSTAPESASAPGGVTARIETGCTGSPCTIEKLEVVIESLRRDDVTITASLEAHGLDGRVGRRRIDGADRGVRLVPGRPLRLTIPATALPVQSVGSLSQVYLGVGIDDESGAALSIATTPLVYEVDDAYQTATVYLDEAVAAERADRLGGDGLQAVRGRVHVDGRMVDVRELPAQGGTGFTLGGGTTSFVKGPPIGDSPQPDPQPVMPTRICYKLNAVYNDAAMGEDVDALPPAEPGLPAVQKIPAAYLRAWIVTGGMFQTTVWGGWLDANGCTPWLSLSGNYVFAGQSELLKTIPGEVDKAHHQILLNSNGWHHTVSWHRGFSVLGSGGSTINLSHNTWDRTMNTTAVNARIFASEDGWVNPGPSTTFVDLGCPSQDPNIPSTDSCTKPTENKVFLGPGTQTTIPDSMYKFIIAHEEGHLVQGQRFQVPGSQTTYYDGDDPDNMLCRCDHVQGANQVHCLQSRETVTAAFKEGFAHFYAAKLYNNRDHADCKFVYYKEILAGFLLLEPPFAVDCAQVYEWRDNYCTPEEETGTELDWMRFLWSVYAKGPNRLSMAEIEDVFDSAAGWALFTLHWGDVETGALNLTVGSPKYNNFMQRANDHGVDNDLGL